MNSFALVQSIINEPSLPQDELRIIAKDVKALSVDERASLVRAADEIENIVRAYHAMHRDMIETQAALTATRERLAEVTRVTFPTITANLNVGYARIGHSP